MFALTFALVGECGCTPEGPGAHTIDVVFVVDTLGLAMAEKTEWCEHIGAITGEFGLDVACLEGGVAPSSWTGESHARFLWPQDTTGAARALQAPACGSPSVLQTLRDTLGGAYLWGADNGMLGRSGKTVCSPFRTEYTQGVDALWETTDHAEDLADVPEAERPVHLAIDAFASDIALTDAPIQLFLNALEPGGHEPRCWSTPDSAACEEAWQVAVSAHLTAADADRRATWLDPDFYTSFLQYTSVRAAADEARWRPLWWQITADTVEAFRVELFEDRLRRILTAVNAANRLDDLHLVVLGDHGENPCVLRGTGDTTLNCGHNGVPTEYSAFVPVFVTPASLAEGWREGGVVGDTSAPWSTMNLAYGLLGSAGVDPPAAWPAMEPVGTATSWTCQVPESAGPSGVHVEDGVAVRCMGATCTTTDFGIPDDETYVPTEVPAPGWAAAYTQLPTWFERACAGEAE